MKLGEWAKRKNLLAIMLCIGIVQIACYYVAGMAAGTDGSMTVSQPDTLLYCQAARRIAEGHPFSFSEGTAVCTGTTSVLYPFILAVPYALGATGDSLLTAGFVLNALFYLVFLFGWGMAFMKWLEEPRSRVVAILLLALAGQPAYCCMAQSDIGCWLAISGLLAMGFAQENIRIYGPVLILAPWIRPEGMICVFGYALILAAMILIAKFRPSSVRVEKQGLKIGLVALAFLSVAGVFTLNYWLTGQAQFSSVANKGYFKLLPLSFAVHRTAADLLSILKELALGSSSSFPRGFYSVPVLSGLFFLVGAFTFPWKSRHAISLLTVLVPMAGGILTVSYSGWQDTNMDRYLSWAFPMLIFFTAYGCLHLSNLVPDKAPRWLPSLILIAFSFGSSSMLWFIFNRCSTTCNLASQFSQECEQALPPKASIGGWGDCGIIYQLSPRRLAHVGGIYSPEFQTKPYQAHAVAILKNEPQYRFDYWFGQHSDMDFIAGDKDSFLGKTVVAGPEGWELRKANWDHWDIQPENIPPQKKLIARLRPGYEKEEREFSYNTIDRYGRPAFLPFIRTGTLLGKNTIECGRVLVGGDEMSIPVATNRDLHIVMRTLPRQKAESFSQRGLSNDEYSFGNPLAIRLKVDSRDLGVTSVHYATNEFSDVSFDIPASALTQTPARISLLGDHITCGYWFYQ